MAELSITMDDSIPQQAGPGAGADDVFWLYELTKGEGIYQGCRGPKAEWIMRQTVSGIEEAGEPFPVYLAAPLAVEDSRERCVSSDAGRLSAWYEANRPPSMSVCASETDYWHAMYDYREKEAHELGEEVIRLRAAMAAASSGAQPEQQQGQGLVNPAMSTSGRTSGDAPANAPQGWQPIKTAPKDGTVIRLFCEGFIEPDFNPGGSVEGFWLEGIGWVGAVWEGYRDCWDTREDIQPSHWMPLPPAPDLHGSPASTDDGQMDNKGIPSHD